MIAQPSAVLRHPGALLALRRASVASISSLCRPAIAMTLRWPAIALSAARYDTGVRVLKLVAATLAGAILALAVMKYEDSRRTATTFEPDRNATVVYRQPPAKFLARADQFEAFADAEERAVAWNYPRAIRTIAFLNPGSREGNGPMAAATRASISLAAVFEPSVMTRVGGFVAFSGKEAAEQSGSEENLKFAAPRKGLAVLMEDVDHYLWEVYQRSPIKKDRTGDFTWKDPAAAKRANMTLPDYVIGGMDPDFREQLYHAGRAMDAAGIQWAILSAFRDDYRQRLASGFKARVGRSLHGGSRATGGYGRGRAVDITIVEGNPETVWDWIDDHGAKYGLYRPMDDDDPAHVQSRGDWRKLAVTLRNNRVKEAGKNRVVAEVSPRR
jgi:hypothetical protein